VLVEIEGEKMDGEWNEREDREEVSSLVSPGLSEEGEGEVGAWLFWVLVNKRLIQKLNPMLALCVEGAVCNFDFRKNDEFGEVDASRSGSRIHSTPLLSKLWKNPCINEG
jgi:hypothetical protein